jgi:WD40 repeat protein
MLRRSLNKILFNVLRLFISFGVFYFSCVVSPNGVKDEFKKPLEPNNNPDDIWKEIETNEKKGIDPEFLYRQLSFESRKTQRRVYQLVFPKDDRSLVAITSFRISHYSLPDLLETEYLEPRNIIAGGFTGISISNDGREILVGASWENFAYLLDWSGNKIRKFSCKEPFAYPEDVKFSSDNKSVYISCFQFVNDKKYLANYKITGEEISFSEMKYTHLEILKDYLFYFSPKEMLMRDFSSGKNYILKFPNLVQSYTFFDEKEWVTGSDGQWTFWSLMGTRLIKKSSFIARETGFIGEDYKLDNDYRNYASLSPSGKYLLTGGLKGAYIWNRNGELQKKLSGHSRNVSAVAFSQDGNYIVTASPDKLILWGKETTEPNLE